MLYQVGSARGGGIGVNRTGVEWAGDRGAAVKEQGWQGWIGQGWQVWKHERLWNLGWLCWCRRHCCVLQGQRDKSLE